MLAAFELLKEEPPEPPDAERSFRHVPKEIAPKLQKKTMEVRGIILIAICSGCHKMLPSCLVPILDSIDNNFVIMVLRYSFTINFTVV